MIKHESGRPPNGFLTYVGIVGTPFINIYKRLHIANVNVFNMYKLHCIHVNVNVVLIINNY